MLLDSFGPSEAVERSSEEDAEGVVGGWKKSDLVPTFLSSLGGRVWSAAKVADMAVCIEEVMFNTKTSLEC